MYIDCVLLSQTYSGESLAASPPPTSGSQRRPSVTCDPPRKAHKPCSLLSPPDMITGGSGTAADVPISASDKRQNGLISGRSSTRLTSVRSLTTARSSPALGGVRARPDRMSKSVTKTELGRKNAAKSTLGTGHFIVSHQNIVYPCTCT